MLDLVIIVLLLILFIFAVGGATLIFSVELLELGKKSVFSIPTDKGFWTYAGLLALVVLGGYELYRRANKKEPPSKDKDSTTARTTNRKSKKKSK
jgi:hypothetical protein